MTIAADGGSLFGYSNDGQSVRYRDWTSPSTLHNFDIASATDTVLSVLSTSGLFGSVQESTSQFLIYSGEESAPGLTELFSLRLDRDAPLPFEKSTAAEDPDGDGLINLIEHLHGTDPLIPDARSQVRVGIETIVGMSFASVQFHRQTNAELDVTIERSTDLIHWTPIASNLGNGRQLVPLLGRCVLSEVDGEVYVRGVIPVAEEQRQHFRIRATAR